MRLRLEEAGEKIKNAWYDESFEICCSHENL